MSAGVLWTLPRRQTRQFGGWVSQMPFVSESAKRRLLPMVCCGVLPSYPTAACSRFLWDSVISREFPLHTTFGRSLQSGVVFLVSHRFVVCQASGGGCLSGGCVFPKQSGLLVGATGGSSSADDSMTTGADGSTFWKKPWQFPRRRFSVGQQGDVECFRALTEAQRGRLGEIASLVECVTQTPINPLSINDIVSQTAPNFASYSGGRKSLSAATIRRKPSPHPPHPPPPHSPPHSPPSPERVHAPITHSALEDSEAVVSPADLSSLAPPIVSVLPKTKDVRFNESASERIPSCNESSESGDFSTEEASSSSSAVSQLLRVSGDSLPQHNGISTRQRLGVQTDAIPSHSSSSTSSSSSFSSPLLPLSPLPSSAATRYILPETLLHSANWVQRELPIRLAHRLHDFHRLPHIIVANSFVAQVHLLYCKAFAELRAFGGIHDLDEEKRFTKVLRNAVEEHSQVVSLMQRGISQLKVSHPDIVLDHFLDRLFVTRIGNRVLAEHHLALHEDFSRTELNPDYIGIVNQRTRPAKMIRLIADRVSQVALQNYGRSPQVHVVGDVDVSFPFIPEHLRFIIFEMLKNSIRATVERHRDCDQLPLVTVGVYKGQTEVFIKIQDKGGGIPASSLNDVWKYGFTTVRGGCGSEKREMAGYGFGLPLSRLYARYFGGDLDIKSMAGYGLDAYIRLPRLGTQRESEWMLNNHLHHHRLHRHHTLSSRPQKAISQLPLARDAYTRRGARRPHNAANYRKPNNKNRIISHRHTGFEEVDHPLTYTSINGHNLYN